MAGQKVAPVNVADELVLKILVCNDARSLEIVMEHLPASLVELMGTVRRGECDSETARQLARSLESRGLIAATVAAYLCEAVLLPDGVSRAQPYIDIIAIERRLGLHLAADAHQRVLHRLLGEGNSGDEVPQLSRDGLSVRCALADPDGHRAVLDSLPDLPLRNDPLRDPFFMKTLWFGDRYGFAEDYSFVVVDEAGRPILLVECGTRGDLHLGCREVGIELTSLGPDPRLADAELLAVAQLESLAVWAGCRRIHMEFPASAPPSEALEQRIVHMGWRLKFPIRNAWVELGRGMAEIEAGYRTSTRQSVRWGRKNVAVRDSSDPTLDVLALYREMNIRLRKAPVLSDAVLGGALHRGDVHAFAGFHGGDLVALLLTSRHGTSTYEMAAMRSGPPKLSLTHILVHSAIEYAQSQGQARFDFGPIYEGGEFGSKMKSIALFKAGFASTFEVRDFIAVNV